MKYDQQLPWWFFREALFFFWWFSHLLERDSARQLLEICPCVQVCLLPAPGTDYVGACLEEEAVGSTAGRLQLR